MKTLIVGFGSIGSQHYEALNEILNPEEIYIYSRRNLEIDNCINTLEGLSFDQFDYIVLSNESSLHKEWLRKIENVDSKILVEKPLFSKKTLDVGFKNKKNIYVGYFLRIHPLIEYLKQINNIKIQKVEFINHSWLPDWRSNIDYQKSVSAKRNLGGGVLNELSHDLDLAKFLFGEYEMTNHTLKISEELKLDVYDSFKGESVTKKDEIKIEFSLSMAVKKIEKYIKIYTKDNIHTADFINNTYSSGKEIKSINNKKSLKKTLLKAQHQMILNNDVNDLSNFDDGLWLVNLIDEIQKEYA